MSDRNGSRRAENTLKRAFIREVLGGRGYRDVTLDLALAWSRTQSDIALLKHRNLGKAALRYIRELADASDPDRPIQQAPDSERVKAMVNLAEVVMRAPGWQDHAYPIVALSGDGVRVELHPTRLPPPK